MHEETVALKEGSDAFTSYAHAIEILERALVSATGARSYAESTQQALVERAYEPYLRTRPDGSPLLDGKNEKTREAQASEWLLEDDVHRECFREAQEARLLAARADVAVEVARERVKLWRAALAYLTAQTGALAALGEIRVETREQ